MYTEKSKEYVYRYKAEKIKRVPLDMQRTEYELLREHAVRAGQSVNSYIKQAIRERMQKERAEG